MKKIFKATSIALLVSVSQFAYSASITDTYASGDTLTAAKMNSIKSAVNDNDSRVSALESANPVVRQTVAIDCSANAAALASAAFTANTTYNITGACNGPVIIKNDGVYLVGSSNITDSIVLLAPNNGLAAVNVEGAHDVQITNLFLDITSFGDAATANDTEAAGLYAGSAQVILRDSRIQGGLYGMNPYRNAVVRLEGTNSITEFVITGITVGDNSNIRVNGPVTVTSTRTDGSYMAAVEAYRSGVVDIRSDVVISVPTTLANSNSASAISSNGNSTVKIRKTGMATVNGTIDVNDSGTVSMNRGTITGGINVGSGGVMSLSNVPTFTGDINVGSGGVVSLINGTTLTGNVQARSGYFSMNGGSISGTIGAEVGSVIELQSVNHTNVSSGAVSVGSGGAFSSNNSSLGNFSALFGANVLIGATVSTTVAGGIVGAGSFVRIQDASVTGDILGGPGASLSITNSDLNSNNIYLCGAFGAIDSVSNILNAGNTDNCAP